MINKGKLDKTKVHLWLIRPSNQQGFSWWLLKVRKRQY